MVFLQKIAEKAAEVESLAQKLSDEKKINKDLSVATTKLQKLLETTHKQLQKEKSFPKSFVHIGSVVYEIYREELRFRKCSVFPAHPVYRVLLQSYYCYQMF